MPTAPPEELSLVPMSRQAPRAASSPVERSHRGPGWFDSSWELSAGCEVREGWPADAGLREWIEAWLRQPAMPATLAQGGA